jgi:mono/diheme cytochrome c family protein
MKLSRTSPLLAAVLAASAVFGLSCKPEKTTFRQAACGSQDEAVAQFCAPRTFAGGVTADAHTLDDGYEAYMLYCYACHGEKGDGKGPASYGLRPPPRNFREGLFKFARLRSSDDVANDEDLARIVKGGLHGTAMLPWDIPDVELNKIIQYIKTFAPKKWEKKKKSGEPVKVLEPFELPADPWAGKEQEAVSRGKELYHFKAECVNCHPAYAGKEDLYKLSLEASKREPDTFKAMGGFRDDFHGSVAKDSQEYGVRILPPDFAFSEIRSVREGKEMEDLFRILSYGVYPIMPAWKDALPDKDIWAIAHYVRSLMAMRGTPQATAMRETFTKQASFEIPKAPEPTPPPAAEGEKKEGDAAAEKKDEKAGDKKDEKKDEKKGDKH